MNSPFKTLSANSSFEKQLADKASDSTRLWLELITEWSLRSKKLLRRFLKSYLNFQKYFSRREGLFGNSKQIISIIRSINGHAWSIGLTDGVVWWNSKK
jgi:hypothetical protein